jgi:hypothetical protein
LKLRLTDLGFVNIVVASLNCQGVIVDGWEGLCEAPSEGISRHLQGTYLLPILKFVNCKVVG